METVAGAACFGRTLIDAREIHTADNAAQPDRLIQALLALVERVDIKDTDAKR
jgi:hypothetical protein